jgi:hypothetical protein
VCSRIQKKIGDEEPNPETIGKLTTGSGNSRNEQQDSETVR